MSPLWRKAVSALCVASLLLAAFPVGLLAAGPAPIDPVAAMKYLKDVGVYSGDSDVLKSYLLNSDNQLTPIGEALYRSLKTRYNAAEAVEALKPSFDKLRANGAYDDGKRQTVERALASFQEKFGEVSSRADGTVEGSYQWGTLVEAYMSGLAASAAPKGTPNYSQIALADGSGYEFWDAEGLAFRINQHQVTTYNRELQKAQKAMNADRPRQVPFIPENGRYSFEMLQYSYWRLKNQYDDIALALKVDRMAQMASLLGIQVKDERFYQDPKLLEDLETKAKAKKFYHRDRYWTVFEIVEKRMEQRRFYLDGADKAVKLFESDMNAIKGAPTITDAQVQTMTLNEKNTLRWLSLSVLTSQEYAIRNQMEVLDPSSPDAQMLQEALKQSPLDAETRRRYNEQGGALRRRLEALQGVLAGARRALVASDYSGSLDMVQAALGSAQRELGEISADYSLYIEAPTGAFMAAAESGKSWRNGQLAQSWGEGWTLGNWAVKVWGAVGPSAHRARFERVGAQLPAYDNIARLIADNKMAEARRAVIAMNPDAAKRFQEIRFSGGNEAKVTDAVRMAASLRANRMELTEVAAHNKWARTAGSYITWTVTLALGAPMITGALTWGIRGAEAVANFVTKIPAVGKYAALPVRVVEHAMRQVNTRVATLDIARSEIPASLQTSFIGRYVASSGVRLVNAGGRQLSFTALSGGISTGFTMGQHAWDGSDSNFTGYGDAAWQGFSGGVVWANDSFHPLLGYIGVPSSAYSGIRYVSPAAESLAARGFLGNIGAAADGIIGRNVFSKVLSMEAASSGQWATRLVGENLAGQTLKFASKAGAFSFIMTDQIAKYALFSKGVSVVARELTYANNLDTMALPGVPGEDPLVNQAREIERRIKQANAAGHAWEASPIWLALPVFPAEVALQSAIHQRATEGMRQYDKAGRTQEYANAFEGQELPLLSGRVKSPLSQRIFDWSWKTQESSDIWVVTKEARTAGIRKSINEAVGAADGNLVGVNPRRFYDIMEMPDNKRLKNGLAINDEVRELARRNLAETLVANPELAKAILDAKLGSEVPGFGRVTFKNRRELAATLHVAETALDVKVPKDILAKLGPAHERYVASDRLPKQPAADALLALKAVGKKAPGLDKAADHIAESVAAWRSGKGPYGKAAHYTDLIPAWRQEMQARVQKGEMTAKEAGVVGKFLDAVTAIEARFNSFNNPATVRAITSEVVGAIKTEFAGGSKAARDVISHFERKLAEWRPTEGQPVAGRGAGDAYAAMIRDFEAALRKAKTQGLTTGEQTALLEAIGEMKNAPWAVRDKGGNPLPGWRPEQFESFATALSMMMKQGKGGQPIRLFQMLKTGGGKTMLTYEGLLPFAEADAKAKNMEVAFLTVQSNLEAQARADYFAYKKLDSKLTFDTYEGLKTKIAEGKTKGQKALHKYWILGDEMDGAALQPALTIGEVTGRITRRSSVYNRIEELDLSLSNRLENAVLGQAKSALQEARSAHAEAKRLDLPPGSAVEKAAERLVRAAEEFYGAAGPEAAARGRQGMLRASDHLRSLMRELPPGQASAVAEVEAALGAMKKALDAPIVRVTDAGLVGDMQSAFRRQRNLLELAGSEEGVMRLVMEARKMRMAGEQKVSRLRENLLDTLTPEARARAEALGAEVEASRFLPSDFRSGPAAERGTALRAEIEIVKVETRIASKFEAVDVGARVLSLSESQVALEAQVARGEGGPKAATKLADVKNQIAELEGAMTPQARAGHAEHREAVRQVYEAGVRLAEADAAVRAAAREGKPAEALRSRLNALEAERATARARVIEKTAELGSGAADGAFGPGLQRLRILSGRITEAKVQAEAARSEGRSAAAQQREVRALEAERSALLKRVRSQAREEFAKSGEEILAIAKASGQENLLLRMLQARRRLLESFAGDESPIYSVYREMKNDMEPIATNKQLLSENEAVANKAADVLLRKVDGGNLFSNLPGIIKMTYQVFAGKPVTVPINQVGLTRLNTAKLLKALFSDPIMPPGQRESLFWTMAPSLLFPKGIGGRSSWVRAELLKLAQAFHENPAGIRFDGLTKKVNVVHNGQWFESMDNESRRFWELEYGADLTLPYTHRSISTIRDLTTDKRAHFISFSGTAGEKFRQHLRDNKVTLAGEGSKAPEGVKMDLRPGQTQKIDAIREALENSSALSRDHVVIKADDVMPPKVKAEVDAYMAAHPVLKGKDVGVVEISKLPSAETRAWLANLRATQPSNTSLVVLSVSDTRVLKLVRNYLIRSGKVKESEIAMVFSDAEFLRLNRPDAKVHEQMNLAGLEEGRVRVLILDTRVGGRGLDLNYKGDKRGVVENPFRGYSNYNMLVIDPHEMSAVHLLQAQGRIDVGRVLAGARRDFSMVMDVKAVQGEAVFRKMATDAPFFVEMRRDPALEAYARSRGATTIDWALIHDYMVLRELGGTPEGVALANKYRAVVQEHLERRQLEVEEDQLRSSSVSDEPSSSPGRHPGLLRLAPGR